MAKYPSTVPGFTNKHGQRVIERTGWPSGSMNGQTVYRVRCGACGFEYGANGCDLHLRRCPRHQDGAKGELLREARLNLFAQKAV